MKLILAQGNPGKQYERTRHNVGFLTLDALVERESASWQASSKFNADIAELQLNGEKVVLAKPTTFYNETGRTGRAIVDFYKLDPTSDVLVIHDEPALPFGTIRVRDKGSDAGNNGIKSLNAHLGDAYTRLRIGVWNELRDRMNDADFVLSSFSKAEQEQLAASVIPATLPLITAFIRGTLEPHSTKTLPA